MILENKAAKGWWQAVQKTTEQKAAGRPARLNYKMKTQLQLYALLAPVLILIFIFCYLPLYGLLIAFQDWYPGMPFLDFTGATKWVGLKHFISFFQNPYFWRLIKNTLVLSALNLGVAFWIPIGFALLINELRLVKFKKFAQTASYLPYFISSVVVAGMALSFLSSDGIINKLIVLLGGEPFEPENQRELLPFIKNVKVLYPNKTIWCYTGNNLEHEIWQPGPGRCEVTDEFLQYIDVLVDGDFVQDQYDISLRFRGSSNQRIIDMNKTRAAGRVVLWQDDPIFADHKM